MSSSSSASSSSSFSSPSNLDVAALSALSSSTSTTPNSAGEYEVHRVFEKYNGPKPKPVRVWADGCFDFFHWGHANALRQAKQMGDILVVGIHSDAQILKHKGPPVMTEKERYLAVAACKWVDEIVENAPYVTQLSTLDTYNIDFCVHGEDITTDEFGNDSYGMVKKAGRYQTIKRAEGVSTTEIVGRMILMTKAHFDNEDAKQQQESSSAGGGKGNGNSNSNGDGTGSGNVALVDRESPSVKISTDNFYSLATTKQILLFSQTVSGRPQLENHQVQKVVYIDGAWDLFHVGHIEALRQAKAMGDYLIVGVHADSVVNKVKGGNLPILNLHERVLSVLACRFTDEVVIGAPWQITEKALQQLHITTVAHGTCSDYPANVPDPYVVPKKSSIYRQFESTFTDLTTSTIIHRIIENRLAFEARQKKKARGLEEINKQQEEAWKTKVGEASESPKN